MGGHDFCLSFDKFGTKLEDVWVGTKKANGSKWPNAFCMHILAPLIHSLGSQDHMLNAIGYANSISNISSLCNNRFTQHL